jgi:aspartate-semialdehyde dehydrogenase
MSQSTKHSEGSQRSGLFKVAIVGAATLAGKELKDILSERNFPTLDTKLLDEEDALGQLEAVGEEPTFIQSVLPEHLSGVDFCFFASDAPYTANSWEMARSAGSDIIDLSYALESQPDAQLRSPWLEQELGKGHPVELASTPVVVAHPAAVALALILVRVQRAAAIRSVNATVLEPASEHGRGGMDELHDQTVNLLSFQQMPTTVFGTQVAFNIVAALGGGTASSLDQTSERIARHFRTVTDGTAPEPSLMVLQAPVFHAHTFSIYFTTEASVSVDDLRKVLEGEHVTVLTEPESPSNVNAAGAGEIQLSLRADSRVPNGFWIWAASDNLRISALQAVECAEDMAATRPRGQVQ